MWRTKSPQCRPIKGQASTGNEHKANNPGGVCSEGNQSGVLADTFMPLTGKVSQILKMNLFQNCRLAPTDIAQGALLLSTMFNGLNEFPLGMLPKC
jgi:hypothetical protein